jgi:hypothetical protein
VSQSSDYVAASPAPLAEHCGMLGLVDFQLLAAEKPILMLLDIWANLQRSIASWVSSVAVTCRSRPM